MTTVYNLHVEGYHTTFVGALAWGFAAWVHDTDPNQCGGGAGNSGQGQPGSSAPVPNPAQQAAANAARGFGNLQCQEAANAMRQALQRGGHTGQVIELRGGGQRGFIVSNSLPPNAPAISQNGRHVGVRVGDLVFDNLHPNGMPYDQWIRNCDAIGGVRLHSVSGF